ncbi:MAG: tetratricopeptide repeat protein [Ignavibacteriales bacterium]|nr:tetratricopeptide repeat protein [Ignavibacteriales bacterium]
MFNKITIYLLVFILGFGFLNAQDLENIMKTGNDFYQNKQYDQAIENYESILMQGYVSSDLYYNLGNSYFRNGDVGKAILNFEKSLKLSPSNEDAAYNLRIANARTVDKIQEIPPIFFIKWWEVLLTTFTSTGWQVIIFIFYIFLLVCIALYFLVRNVQIQKYAFIFGILNIAALVFTVIFFFASLERESSNDYGILLSSVTTAKISPDKSSNDAFVIHEGIKFKIEDEVNNWVKIKLSDGKIGWIPTNTFDII